MMRVIAAALCVLIGVLPCHAGWGKETFPVEDHLIRKQELEQELSERAKKEVPAPAETSEEKSKSRLWWWVAAGTVVLGGTIWAVNELRDDDSSDGDEEESGSVEIAW